MPPRVPASPAASMGTITTFWFGGALARFGVAERRLLAALGGQDLRLLLTLGAQDFGLAEALRFEDRRAFLTLGLHLPRHGAGEVRRRDDILDLDARDLGAP